MNRVVFPIGKATICNIKDDRERASLSREVFLLRLRVLIQIVLEMIFPIEASNLVIPYSNMEKRTVQNPTICG